MINDIGTYTIFIKNNVNFKFYNRKKRNLLESTDLSTCQYNRDTDPFCPIFPIQMILDEAEPNRKLQDTLLEIGGVIQIGIEWDCDLDWGNEKNCGPKYHFERFDPADTNTSPGFNFRYADKYLVDEDEQRNLIKAYGLRFIITVTGKAGAFDFIPFFLTIGAGIGLLAIPTLVSDCILLNFTKKRKFYSEIKEEDYKKEKSPILNGSTVHNENESRF